jgi:DNA modification methylase
MEIELTPIDRVIPYARNPRRNEGAVAKVAGSLAEFGWRQPIVVDEQMVVVAGHTRLLAARQLGMDRVPVHVASGLSPEQIKAYRIADNRSAQEAEWDDDLLALEIGDLMGADYDLSQTAFDEGEIARLLAANADRDNEDNAPDLEERVISSPGEVWRLGKHRLMCGDATSAEDVARLLDGVEPHLMVTDPPYGVEYDPSWRAEAGVNKNKEKMGKVNNDARADWGEAWSLFPGDVCYVWHAGINAAVVHESLAASDFAIRSQIIWVKDRFALSRGHYHWQHEPCWYAVRKQANWHGDRSQTTVWHIPAREDGGHGHGTQKPVECMRRPMLNNSSPGQAVYDPFVGSGTTLIAAQTEARSCLAMEIDPAYVDVTIRRWQQFTNERAIRESDGVEFDALEAKERAA